MFYMAIKNVICKAAEAETTSLITMVFMPCIGERRGGEGRGGAESEPFKCSGGCAGLSDSTSESTQEWHRVSECVDVPCLFPTAGWRESRRGNTDGKYRVFVHDTLLLNEIRPRRLVGRFGEGRGEGWKGKGKGRNGGKEKNDGNIEVKEEEK